MAFWGVVVKPGKPFVHRSNGARQRLHISQAMLGIGSATNKSIVQCNVGNKSPILLCSLFPDRAESCLLNLEFEEAEEVIFSVLGPRSVHLSGFYLGNRGHYTGDDESESYGEDIAGTETERSNDEDEYEDSFIDDDDDDPEVFSPPPSPSLNNADNGKPMERKGRQRRLRKKYHPGESDKEGSFQQHNIVDGKTKAQASESEDEESFFRFSLLNKKSAVKDSKIDGPGMYPENHQSGVPEVGTKMKRKREEEFIESPIEVDKANAHNKLKENLDQQGQVIAAADKEAGQVNGFVPTSDEAANENCLKKKKKKKKRAKEEKAQHEEDIVENNVNPVVTENLALEAQQVTDGEDSGKKDIKKKKKKHRAQHSEADRMNKENVLLADRNVKLDSKMKDRDADDDCRVRKLPNGLIIEQLETGNANGKVVAPGKKISVHYVGKFMENGLVFDSNIGGKPLKFCLGSGEVMKGWDEGLDGMRIGGKRRLTIPPSLSYANRGSNHKVSSDSWLVYDIEVVRIR